MTVPPSEETNDQDPAVANAEDSRDEQDELAAEWEEMAAKPEDDRVLNQDEIDSLLGLRDKARENKNYKEADRIRDVLLDKGVLIEDKDGKTLWKFK